MDFFGSRVLRVQGQGSRVWGLGFSGLGFFRALRFYECVIEGFSVSECVIAGSGEHRLV